MTNQLEEFFHGRDIFITGGSGFIGKCLIEKILHSFDVNAIYVLIRGKNGVSPDGRLERLKNDQAFTSLKRDKPLELNKLVAIPGDVSHLDLNLSPASKKLLHNVSIILHSAATIRFDESLKTAILINVRGTQQVLKLASDLPQLRVFLHISTLFSNCNRKFIEEKVYPAPTDWRNCIKIAESADEDTLTLFTNKFTQGFPNTYTFTKALSENVVSDFRDRVPVAIVRPSIVLCALFDPIEGYIDNLAGSTSVAVAGGAGVLRNLLCDPDMTPNQVPVDLVIRIAIISAWKTATFEKDRLPFVCNISGEILPEHSIRSQLDILKKVWVDIPYNRMLWKPDVHPILSEKQYFIRFIFTQLLPAIWADIGLKLFGHKPALVKIQRKILMASKGFQFFLSTPLNVGMDNMQVMIDESEKCPGFETRTTFIRAPLEYGRNVAMSCRRFILKEKDVDLPKAKKLYNWLTFADVVLKAILVVGVFYAVSYFFMRFVHNI